MIRLLPPLAGLIAHQFKHVQDAHPSVFPAGWRELSSYVLGSLVIWEMSSLLLRHSGASEQEVERSRSAHLQTLVLVGGGVAVGWMVDAVLSLRRRA